MGLHQGSRGLNPALPPPGLGTDSSHKGTLAHVWPQRPMAMGQLSYAPRMQDIAFLVVIRSPLAHHYVDFFFLFSEEAFCIPCFLRDLNTGKLSLKVFQYLLR